ncbi:MATE family efflux transporter [Sediminibacillus halophilus]|uniref:Multidrug export protein MepA n=1 Tax=Sediminibacillus halophilus TaxID=482461 RepID=A0A1G9W5B6_9BACI|nr:MATE family efflux transporter [Sediminibacillus halophilus]SDM79699.1 putative efflux protein, MATE family [Sediminibacillus halophilus]
MEQLHNQLLNKSVKKVFFTFFFPSLFGLVLMSVNILVDGIFVGNGVGEVGLASVNLSVPVFSLFISLALWIGIGGGTLYSSLMGKGNQKKAKGVFSLAVTSITILVIVAGIVGRVNVEVISKWLGANADTLPFVMDYLSVLFLFGWLMALQQVLSVFVRNDGSPRLSMVALGTTAIVNIVLNYFMIFTLGLGVKGAAVATVIAEGVGVLILLFHFRKSRTHLRYGEFGWSWSMMGSIFSLGFPSFLAEAGMLVFTAGYNLAVVSLLGTEGVAAFSVVNYLHGFMFLSFFGIESALQPMISYYNGADQRERIVSSVKLGERTAFVLGVILLLTGFLAAPLLVSVFGVDSEEVKQLAIQGIRLFFIGYLFLGFNFVYMTYFQSVGQVGYSSLVILLRSFVFLIALLVMLPEFLGIAGVWLALPLSELMVAVLLFIFARKSLFQHSFSEKQKTLV